MGLETPTYISDFVSTNPTAGDPKSEGDDHIRNMKIAIKASFPIQAMKKLTGTVSGTPGVATTVAHGLTYTKIIGLNVLVNPAAGLLIPPNAGLDNFVGYQYNSHVNATNVLITTDATNSGNIVSQPFTVLLTYEA